MLCPPGSSEKTPSQRKLSKTNKKDDLRCLRCLRWGPAKRGERCLGELVNDPHFLLDPLDPSPANAKAYPFCVDGQFRIFVCAERPIRAGEEVFLSYGDSFWVHARRALLKEIRGWLRDEVAPAQREVLQDVQTVLKAILKAAGSTSLRQKFGSQGSL